MQTSRSGNYLVFITVLERTVASHWADWQARVVRSEVSFEVHDTTVTRSLPYMCTNEAYGVSWAISHAVAAAACYAFRVTG